MEKQFKKKEFLDSWITESAENQTLHGLLPALLVLCSGITNYRYSLHASLLKVGNSCFKTRKIQPNNLKKKCFLWQFTSVKVEIRAEKNVHHVFRNINYFFSRFDYIYKVYLITAICGKANRITFLLYNAPQ